MKNYLNLSSGNYPVFNRECRNCFKKQILKSDLNEVEFWWEDIDKKTTLIQIANRQKCGGKKKEKI